MTKIVSSPRNATGKDQITKNTGWPPATSIKQGYVFIAIASKNREKGDQ